MFADPLLRVLEVLGVLGILEIIIRVIYRLLHQAYPVLFNNFII